MSGRLPAHLEVAAIRRLAESMGGFATVLAKGERDAGTIALVIIGRGSVPALYERRPKMDGNRVFELSFSQGSDIQSEFLEKVEKICSRDPDLWLIEVDVPNTERFVAALAP